MAAKRTGPGSRTKIMVDGRPEYLSNTRWVCIAPNGKACGVMDNDVKIRTDLAKAARRYWAYDRYSPEAMLQAGYRLLLVTGQTYTREYYPQMLGGYRCEVEGKSGIFIPDRV